MHTKAEIVEAARLAQLRAFCPEVFAPGTLLYVGACPQRRQCLPELEAAGRIPTIVEVWPENVEHFRSLGYSAVYADVRALRLVTLPLAHYDLAFWWHGPEHLPKADVPNVLAELERRASLVVVSAPWGEYPQEAAYGNPYNEHVSAWEPEDFAALGYRVDTIGERGGRAYSNVLAVKP